MMGNVWRISAIGTGAAAMAIATVWIGIALLVGLMILAELTDISGIIRGRQ